MSLGTPYFSVVTPTYNRSKYIVTAIESVLAQSFKDFELIIVDDGSEDETSSLVLPFTDSDSRVKYIKQKNQGRSVARNVGINSAKGEYICFLDSDDYWLPQHLQNIFDASESLDKPSFIFTALAYKFADEQSEKRFPQQADTKPIDYVIGNQVSTITVAIPREALLKHQFNASLSINEDLELWSKIVSELPIKYIDKVTAIAVQHEANSQALADDHIALQEDAMRLVFENESLKPHYSNKFKNRKMQGMLELRIRSDEEKGDRWSLIKNLIKFLVLYPTALRNRSKLVMLIYALPGGTILKRLIQG